MFQHDFATVQRVLLVEPGQGQALWALFALCLPISVLPTGSIYIVAQFWSFVLSSF